jgi:glycine betaine/proline transport system substrate-binding protein
MQLHRHRKLIGTVAALSLALTACGGSDDTATTAEPGQSETTEAEAAEGNEESVAFAHVEWPGVTVKTQVAATIAESLGYEVEDQPLTLPILLESLSAGDVDAFLGVWRPSMDSQVDPLVEDGSVSISGTNLEDTLYQNATLTSGAEELGITSMADLDEHRDAFGGVIYGIEPGNDGNQIILDMIEADTYGLGDWELKASSTNGMLAEVERAGESGEPIAFLAWEPHWMNLEYDITYLEDPEDVWGGAGSVETALNSEFADANPNLATFLSQMQVEKDWQSAWIESFDKEGLEAAKVAEDWVAEHLSDIEPWLEGVEAADGRPAFEVLSEQFSG